MSLMRNGPNGQLNKKKKMINNSMRNNNPKKQRLKGSRRSLKMLTQKNAKFQNPDVGSHIEEATQISQDFNGQKLHSQHSN